MANPPTHADLVERAACWLWNQCQLRDGSWPNGEPRYNHSPCPMVFTEMRTWGPEEPDAIGFLEQGNVSVLIECKTCRRDWRRDKKKPHRKHPERGVGAYRFYMVPAGMLTPGDMPDHWGLLSVAGRTVTIEKDAEPQERNIGGETRILYSACRRLQAAARKTDKSESEEK